MAHRLVVVLSSMLLCSLVSGCTLLNQLKEPPNAFVGQPRVYDGHLLLSEFAARLLQIEKEIEAAKITDVDTTARTISSSSAGFNVSANLFSDPETLSRIESGITTRQNQTALQNLRLQNIQQTIDRNNLINDVNTEDIQNRSIAQATRIEAYKALVEHYTELLQSDDEDSRTAAAAALKEIDTTFLDSTPIETDSVSDSTLPGAGDAEPVDNPDSGTAASNALPDSKTETIEGPNLQDIVAILKDNAEALAKLSSPPSTRREKFQQYQSYLDELHAQKNRYLLDDAVRQRGSRYVRLVFPVYVPPSSSEQSTNIEFSVHAETGTIEAHDIALHARVLTDVLNYLAGDLDDNVRELGLDEAMSDSINMSQTYNAILDEYDCGNSVNKDSDWNKINSKLLKKHWELLNAARRVGFSHVAQFCTLYTPEKGWYLPANKVFEKTSNAAQSLQQQSVRVYALDPTIEREKYDQTLSRLRSASVSLKGSFGGATDIGSAGLNTGIQNQILAQAATRTPTIAAYQTPNSSTSDKSVTFGWHIYPRLTINTNQKLVTEHIGTDFLAGVDLSVPINQKAVIISIAVNGDQTGNMVVELPPVGYDERFSNITDAPIVIRAQEYGIQSIKKSFTITLSGHNLWRTPRVYAGGRRADRVEFTSRSERNLRAVFNNLSGVTCDYNQKVFNKTDLTYHGSIINSAEHCAVKIWLHTSSGREYAGSLILLKSETAAKPKTKVQSSTAELVNASLDSKGELILVWRDSKTADYAKALKIGDAVDVFDIRDNASKNSVKLLSSVTAIEPIAGRKDLFHYTVSGKLPSGYCRNSGKLQADCKLRLAIKNKPFLSGLLTIRSVNTQE